MAGASRNKNGGDQNSECQGTHNLPFTGGRVIGFCGRGFAIDPSELQFGTLRGPHAWEAAFFEAAPISACGIGSIKAR
jgi:hypothetical protein